MQGKIETIKTLNNVLTLLLTGINQYFLHSRMNENWGFNQLKKHDYDVSIVLMKESDKLMKRILFLEGLPNLQALGKLYIGENVEEALSGNDKFEQELHKNLLAAIAECEASEDYISRDYLEDFLTYCEDQIDWIESQKHLMKEFGLKNYLQSAV